MPKVSTPHKPVTSELIKFAASRAWPSQFPMTSNCRLMLMKKSKSPNGAPKPNERKAFHHRRQRTSSVLSCICIRTSPPLHTDTMVIVWTRSTGTDSRSEFWCQLLSKMSITSTSQIRDKTYPAPTMRNYDRLMISLVLFVRIGRRMSSAYLPKYPPKNIWSA